MSLKETAYLVAGRNLWNYKSLRLCVIGLASFVGVSAAYAEGPSDNTYSVGGFFGIYNWTNPISAPDFTDHYVAAVTASITLWEPESVPLMFEAEGVFDVRFGQEWNAEVGVNPLVVRWTYFPWNEYINTSVRVAPVGVSYLFKQSELEGDEAPKFSYLTFFEVTFSSPDDSSLEVFFRQHHRCDFFNLMDDTDSNGSDFYAVGLRKYF